MPLYDYECLEHGAFDCMRPIAESGAMQECPACGRPAPRVFVCTPRVLDMDPARRAAFATNERSAHEPRSSKRHVHGPGCGCGGKSGRGTGAAQTADGGKTFLNRRPWMISH